jgi:hypothetical protein
LFLTSSFLNKNISSNVALLAQLFHSSIQLCIVVKRRDILRTDRHIVLRTWLTSLVWIEIRLLSRGFITGLIYYARIWELNNELLKTNWIWHPPLFKDITQTRGGRDAISKAIACLG